MPNQPKHRYGRVYVRRKRRGDELTENALVQDNRAEVPSPINNRVSGRRSDRSKRTRFNNFTYATNENRPILTTVSRQLLDVPVQNQLTMNISVFRSSTILHSSNDGFVEVPIQLLQPSTIPLHPQVRETLSISTAHASFLDPRRAPLGAFDAPASASGTSHQHRTSRSRRTNFDSMIIQGRLSRQERNTINQRRRREMQSEEQRNASRARERLRRRRARALSRNDIIAQRRRREMQTNDQRDASRARDALRKRILRAMQCREQRLHRRIRNTVRERMRRRMQTYEQRLASRSIQTLNQRRSREMQSAEQRNIIQAINTANRRNNRRSTRRTTSGRPRFFRRVTTQNDISTLNAEIFRQACRDLEWKWCSECNARFPDIKITEGICDLCLKDKRKNPRVPLFSAANMMNPGIVPIELSRLSNLESILIARIHPMMSVYRVKGQQYKYSGNVINFAQDVNLVANVLPCRPADLSALLIVKRSGHSAEKEFVVRREYVRQALLWLKENHRYYGDISIDNTVVDELPENGVPADLPNVEEVEQQQNNQEITGQRGPTELQEDGLHIDEFEGAGTFATTVQPNQQRCIRRVLQMPDVDHTLANMPLGSNPINEYSTEGYISMAFPTLFPYGAADLRQPRVRDIKPSQYFQYLMTFDDGRFAKDTRFRYFAWNSMTRWRASQLGNVYVNSNPHDGNLSMQDIRMMVESGDNRLAARVSYYAQQLRGTRAYWYIRLKELTAMVNQLGAPTIFFTLSAADMQWPELFDLLDTEKKLQNLSPMEKRKEKEKLLNDNPLIAAWFLQARVELFFKYFLKTEFSVVDYWYRYEWQNRGSGHVHGFLWIKDSPDVSQVTTNAEHRQRVCEYFDRLVCTMNPDPSFSEQMQNHPCARVIPVGADLQTDENDYISLVNWVERHSKCGTYCLRLNKRTKQMVCRFKYPMEILEQSKIIEEPPDSNMYRYMGRRNDELVNSHNRAVLQTWRANIDWSAIISILAVVHYIAKYAAKAEPASKNFNDTLRGIVEDMRNPCQNSTSAVRRLLMKCVSERDISAQEVCHLIMGYALNRSSRKFVLLNLNENSMFSRSLRRRRNTHNEDGVVIDHSFFGRYLQRRVEFENVTLLAMAKMHYWSRGDWRNYKTHAVVRVIPEFDRHVSPESDKWEGFCRQQVLLHHHYRSIDDAKGGFQLWADQYNHLGMSQVNAAAENIEDELEDTTEIDEADYYHEEWMQAAAQGPTSVSDVTIDLGMRDVDTTYDWGKGFANYPNIDDDRKFVRNNLQSQEDANNDASYCPLLIDLNQLSPQQKSAHDLVLNSLIQGSTIRLIVSGGAGTGKSTLINAIVSSTTELFGSRKAVRVMAPTGVAAFNIGGSTIHHEMGIYGELSSHNYNHLEGEYLGKMQEEFKDAKLLIIDEYSMIGRKLLAQMDFRCRDIFSNDVWFGNVSIVIVGDIRQLPPVCDSTLYSEGGFYMQTRGQLAYSSFDKCIRLSQVFRQAGGEQAIFRDALLRLSNGNSSYEDWGLFKSRDLSTFNQDERNNFRNSLRLFPTRKAAEYYNIESLRALNKPVARIDSINNCQTAKNADADEAKGLQQQLLLSIGSRVMLRTNLATNYGLVNGARGIVEDIVYASGRKSPDDMPLAVMVNFDVYPGPKFKPPTNIIPIVPQTASWKSSETNCQRTQIPLVLCWAITVHKSQGLTLDKVVVDIGERESLGLTFVALSRTRKLMDLAFSPMFGFERLDNIKKCRGLPLRNKEEDRLEQLSIKTLSN